MKILHLYSDWKWTGPAEPAIQACQSLQNRGHEVLFACPRQDVEYDESVGEKARELGLQVTHELGLNRYFKLRPTCHDLHAIPRFLRRHRFDLIHCHLSHDHAFAGALARLTGGRRPPLIRSLYRREVLRGNLANRFLLRHMTDGWVTFSESFRQEYQRRFSLPAKRVIAAPMSIDLQKFSPERPHRDMRAEFGIPADAPLIGIVGRFQRYRRAEVFVQAAQLLRQQMPTAHFLIIGRSSQMQETVVEPIARLGLQDAVTLAGYRTADYVDTLACLDVFSLLMPGFDGTARAVREALALGKPCVVSDFGMLPEIVADGVTGRVVASDPEALAAGWLDTLQDPARYAAMSKAASQHANQHYRLEPVGEALEQLYQRIL